jgi:polyisoprenyl-phosphate glycosyltransferase
MSWGLGKISVVVPVYNAAPFIDELTRRMNDTLAGLGTASEVIYVDDSSHDDSADLLRAACRGREGRYTLALTENLGQQRATLEGVRLASGDVILTLDDDLEHPPERIPELLSCLRAGNDLVYAHCPNRGRSQFRNGASLMVMRLVKRAASLRALPSSFRGFRRELCADLRAPVDLYLGRAARRPTTITVAFEPSRRLSSNYGVPALVQETILYLKAITGKRERSSLG